MRRGGGAGRAHVRAEEVLLWGTLGLWSEWKLLRCGGRRLPAPQTTAAHRTLSARAPRRSPNRPLALSFPCASVALVLLCTAVVALVLRLPASLALRVALSASLTYWLALRELDLI
ncbi:hypothetical protein BS50DRAFT_327992 [Corynespora cassiicola Philippines]|uniref:Uncharacterized protein n=1 Tax=Corynespora cassiicola Philippines TaxID=1448308 RepID=A0A2T2NU54_CORCC|nr:hypothetical protein BS50DRAFT_327992 [Corynespora cassiicola Philippines]